MSIKTKFILFADTLLIIIITLISCNDQESPPSGFIKEYKTTTGKSIIVSESHPLRKNLSNIRINTRDLDYNFSEEFFDKDPITDVFIVDLDDNGFDEIYIITTSADSGSFGNVLGFASNRDKSFSIINFPGVDSTNNIFAGYMGHDSFFVENNKLVRTFPIFNVGDGNTKSIEGKRKLIYGLYPGEAMWQLKIDKSENLNNP